jgi:rod shape-determining protein MreC
MFQKLLSNRLFLLILTTLLILSLIIFSSIPGNPLNRLTAPVSAVLDPVQKLVRDAGNRVSDFFTAINEGVELRQENDLLKKQNAELQYQVQQGEEASLRWQELKDAFHIKDSFENYEIYGTTILTREADEWFNIIRVDVGSDNGIEIKGDNSYAVVDVQMHLVGRIMSTDLTSSKVLPILHEGFAVSAKVNEVNGAVVHIHGEFELKNDGLCKVDQIPANVELKVGDELVTSGVGGFFPAGIPIGVIESVVYTSELDRYATLRPYTQIAGLRDLFVLVPKDASDTDTSEPTDLPTITPAS